MVTVTTTAGTEQVTGLIGGIDAGHLLITDDTGNDVAVFAPGVWLSAAVEPS
jgi:hypothetical protein